MYRSHLLFCVILISGCKAAAPPPSNLPLPEADAGAQLRARADTSIRIRALIAELRARLRPAQFAIRELAKTLDLSDPDGRAGRRANQGLAGLQDLLQDSEEGLVEPDDQGGWKLDRQLSAPLDTVQTSEDGDRACAISGFRIQGGSKDGKDVFRLLVRPCPDAAAPSKDGVPDWSAGSTLVVAQAEFSGAGEFSFRFYPRALTRPGAAEQPGPACEIRAGAAQSVSRCEKLAFRVGALTLIVDGLEVDDDATHTTASARLRVQAGDTPSDREWKWSSNSPGELSPP